MVGGEDLDGLRDALLRSRPRLHAILKRLASSSITYDVANSRLYGSIASCVRKCYVTDKAALAGQSTATSIQP